MSCSKACWQWIVQWIQWFGGCLPYPTGIKWRRWGRNWRRHSMWWMLIESLLRLVELFQLATFLCQKLTLVTFVKHWLILSTPLNSVYHLSHLLWTDLDISGPKVSLFLWLKRCRQGQRNLAELLYFWLGLTLLVSNRLLMSLTPLHRFVTAIYFYFR